MRPRVVAALAVVAIVVLLSSPLEVEHGQKADDRSISASTRAASVDDVRSMVVVGDSISASYERHGTGDKTAWWSLLADRIGAEPHVLAEGGSGYLRRGTRCTGTNFLQRIEAHPDLVRRADVVVLEGGVNDRRRCLVERRNGRGDARSSAAEIEAAVRPTIRRVAELAPHAKIIVTVPWGNAQRIASSRWWVTQTIQRVALEEGVEYVDTSTEAIRHEHRTLDGVHPNRHGSQEIYKRVYFRSSLNG